MYNPQITVERIKQMLLKRNMSLAELNNLCNLNKNTIAASANSKMGLSASILFSIAKQLNCSVDYLIDFNSNQTENNFEDITTFYHVSSYIHTNEILKKGTKPNGEFCNLICTSNISTLPEIEVLLKKLNSMKVLEKTGRPSGKWLCEAIFEHVRKTEFPNNPSRVWGIFVTRTYNDAERFKLNCRTEKANIFEIMQPLKNAFKYDMYFWDQAYIPIEKCIKLNGLNEEIINNALEFARKYWSQETSDGNPLYEYIIDGTNDLQIGRQVNQSTIITPDEQALLTYYSSFNEEGKEKLLDNASDMAKLERYKKCAESDVVGKEA